MKTSKWRRWMAFGLLIMAVLLLAHLFWSRWGEKKPSDDPVHTGTAAMQFDFYTVLPKRK